MSSGRAASTASDESPRQGSFVHYRYELRREGEILATGYLLRTDPLEVGTKVTVAGKSGIVRAIEPEPADGTLHLVVERPRSRSRATARSRVG